MYLFDVGVGTCGIAVVYGVGVGGYASDMYTCVHFVLVCSVCVGVDNLGCHASLLCLRCRCCSVVVCCGMREGVAGVYDDDVGDDVITVDGVAYVGVI